uniref:Stress-activated protein kinase JNK n=1 Tax=Syphacia muris TaxID=451379 RepID=A0A158R521_9BILA
MSYDKNLFKEVIVDGRTGPSTFIVPHRYTDITYISAGAQGTVVKAYDTVTEKHVAIKKLHNPFVTKLNAKHTYREFVLIATMRHVNLIGLDYAFSPQSDLKDFNEIYLVMKFMDYNLSSLIAMMKINNTNLSYFTYQMVTAMNYMHRSGIIHRDLKPSNIGVGNDCVLKILDYGLARRIETNERMSMYVVTRYYRAPEVILGLPYTEKGVLDHFDVWSIGCILAEMITRRVLFPGSDRLDQWMKIVQVRGTPSEKFINSLEPHARRFVKSKSRFTPQNLETIFPDSMFSQQQNVHKELEAASARDLLNQMLQIDPDERIGIREAVKHPFIRLWFRKDEWDTPLPENRYDPNTDTVERPLTEWKRNDYGLNFLLNLLKIAC